ncbi:hypothetical protein ACLX1H_007076 [Fusarium chlamydosporum]
MVTIAVAGGTGKVGRTIVEAIVAAGKHEVVVLSREENKALEKELGAPILSVDSHNVDALTQLFEKHNVHTIISTFGMNGPTPPELELIRAAEASQPTKRFISSDWGLPHTAEHAKQANSANNKFLAQEELRKTNLEWTSVHNGFFVDFWGSPAIKSYLHNAATFLDISHRSAAIPGSGNVPVTFTFSDKFNVTYDSAETLKKGQLTELPGHVPMYNFVPKQVLQSVMAAYGLWIETDGFDLDESRALNKEFPDIKPISVREFLQQAWGVKN